MQIAAIFAIFLFVVLVITYLSIGRSSLVDDEQEAREEVEHESPKKMRKDVDEFKRSAERYHQSLYDDEDIEENG